MSVCTEVMESANHGGPHASGEEGYSANLTVLAFFLMVGTVGLAEDARLVAGLGLGFKFGGAHST